MIREVQGEFSDDGSGKIKLPRKWYILGDVDHYRFLLFKVVGQTIACYQ